MKRRLISILKRIGRWIFEELLAVGARALSDYMLVRARYFRAKAQGLAPRRARWLRNRARRWERSAAWLRENGPRAAKEVAREAVEAIPYHSPHEIDTN